MATWSTLASNSNAGNVTLNVEYTVTNVARSGNTVTFNYGVRFTMATNTYTYNSIAAFCPAGGTRYYAKVSGSATSKGTYYYANTTGNTTTAETIPFSYSKTVGVNDTSLSFEIGFGWNAYTPSQKDKKSVTVTFPKGFTNPSWGTYTITSFPSTAYANMPYSYNIALSCSYGSSTGNNSLAWASTSGITMVSTTGTSIAAGARSYTFSNSNIGSHTFRGVINYKNSSGTNSSMANSTTRALSVSFLNPTLTGVSNSLNGTSFYRTATVQSTANATVTGNSCAPTVFTYFSSPDAAGDGSGTGFYDIGSYNAAQSSTISSAKKSYTHPGNKPGTFYSRLSLRGNNGSGTWTEFATAGQVSYTMHEFVVPTATRTITYNKHNVYVGQTKFPVTVQVTNTSKSQYDTLTPTFSVGTCKNNSWSYDTNALGTHSFANGTYNMTLTKTSNPYSVGDTASFRDEMVYKDALNANAYTSVNSTSYTVKTIPQPSTSEISIMVSSNEISKTITAGITGNFDSDLVGQYILYLENASGTTIYAQTTGTIGYDNYIEHTFTYNGSVSENYKVRMVANFALVDENNVQGSITTSYSSTIRVIGGTRIYIKHDGENYDKLFPVGADKCPNPRLAIKYGDTVKYVPLFTDTPSAGTKQLWVRQGGTSYYTLLNTTFELFYPSDNLYPEGNELSYEDISVYKHLFLANYTHQEIHDGDIG